MFGVAGASLYTVTKGALLAWGQSLAAEWAPYGIGVLNLCPGYTRTAMLEEVRSALPEASYQALETSTPLGLGYPNDVADLVVALAGAAGRWVTGVPIMVDGGYSSR